MTSGTGQLHETREVHRDGYCANQHTKVTVCVCLYVSLMVYLVSPDVHAI